MITKKTSHGVWETTASGLLVPRGRTSSLSQESKNTYLGIKEKALQIEALFRETAVPLRADQHLSKLIDDAKTLSDGWLLNELDASKVALLFSAIHVDRIADSILPLKTVEDRSKYLRAIISGNLDLANQTQSTAKDILWEIELWSMLNRHSIAAKLIDPPDIVIQFSEARVGVACKKLYGESHVQNILSQAVSQVEDTFDVGIVAINLDDLMPANNYLRTPTPDTMRAHLSELNMAFLARHERHFQKYLSSGRLVAAIVATSIIVDIESSSTALGLGRQMDLWTIPGLPAAKERQLHKLFAQLLG